MKTTRRRVLQGGAAALALPTLGKAAAPAEDLTLWYRQPAAQWTEALPLGNGRLGAVVFGGVEDERIQINEATLWGGGPHDYAAPGAGSYLATIRQLIFAGQIAEAETLSAKMMGRPSLLLPYQPFCDLHLHFGQGTADDYRRSLALDDAISAVTYQAAGVRYRREVFVSHPRQVLVVRLTADQPGKQDLVVALDSPQPGGVTEAAGADTLQLSGQIQPRQNPDMSWVASWSEAGLRFAAVLRVVAEGGTLERVENRLRVRGADAVTILVSAATSFRNYRDIGGDALGRARGFVDGASGRSYEALRQDHIQDHQRLFHRVQLSLGPEKSSGRPTDLRIADFKTANDPALVALYYQFGRYLLISSSRPGGQPANLQGIWNQDLVPAWGSKWTTNINLQMNYWLAESGALWETQEPLWDLIDDLQVTGAETARVHYGAGGWVLHHNTDLWRATTPVDGAWGVWPMGGVWLVNQMWDHYRFSGDKEFLRKRAYPAMKGALRFVLDTLVEAPKGTSFAGYLVTNPSFSPENQYLLNGKPAHLTYAASMDIELITELFESFRKASKLLGKDTELRVEVKKAQSRLPPLQIGGRGQLQEWIQDFAEAEPDHRHVSHLWGLYPGHGIAPRRTPRLADAARRSLELRGDGGTGWAKAWNTALWARLGDGERANVLLTGLIAESTLPNMFDTCPPFQIDGNFGGAAAIAEMLLQSGDGEVVLLAALPRAWSEGRVRGLRARGGIVVDMDWRDHALTGARLTSDSHQSTTVRVGQKTAVVILAPHRPVHLDSQLRAAG